METFCVNDIYTYTVKTVDGFSKVRSIMSIYIVAKGSFFWLLKTLWTIIVWTCRLYLSEVAIANCKERHASYQETFFDDPCSSDPLTPDQKVPLILSYMILRRKGQRFRIRIACLVRVVDVLSCSRITNANCDLWMISRLNKGHPEFEIPSSLQVLQIWW